MREIQRKFSELIMVLQCIISTEMNKYIDKKILIRFILKAIQAIKIIENLHLSI